MHKEIILKTIMGYLTEKGITKAAAADNCGVSRVYFYSVLNGRNPLTRKLTDKLCSSYGFNPDWIMSGTGNVFLDEDFGNYTPDTSALMKKVRQQESEILRLRGELQVKTEELFALYHKYGITSPIT